MTAKRVLLVDDDTSFVEAIVPLLRRAGCDVRVAHDGGQALVEMGQHRPDLIVLDLMMGPINGWELLWSKCQIPALVNVPAIVVSAYTVIPQPLPPCVVRMLDKPVEPARVVEVVLQVLGGLP